MICNQGVTSSNLVAGTILFKGLEDSSEFLQDSFVSRAAVGQHGTDRPRLIRIDEKPAATDKKSDGGLSLGSPNPLKRIPPWKPTSRAAIRG